jgi:hypothetical protein
MDIQSLSSPVGVKAGKEAVVKNHHLFALAAVDEPMQDKGEFAKIMASADAKDSLLKTKDSPVPPDTRELQFLVDALALLAPVSYNATVPLGMVGSDPESLARGVDGQGGVQSIGDSSAISPASASDPVIATAPGLEARPVSKDAPAIEVSSTSLAESLNLISSSDVGADRPAPAKAHSIDVMSKAALAALLDAQGGVQVQRRLETIQPFFSTTNNTASAEVRAKATAILGLDKLATITGKSSEVEFNSRSPVAQTLLDEAGRKNEALLDILSLGDRLLSQEGQAPTAKQVAYAFQREADNMVSPNSQNLPPSRPSSTESMQTSEKNSYWLANGTQNVALILDGLGDESVAVKISLSGLDARIDIRTDHLALRQMIEGSVQAMKDQLSTEGLTLSGMSVGTSGQEQGMGQGAEKENQSRANPEFASTEETSHSSVLKNQLQSPERPALPKSDGRLSVFA